MKSLGVSLVWILLSGALLTPIGFLPAFAATGTSTTVSSSQNPSTFSQSVTFTATVSPNTAIGSVQFIDSSTSPSTILGTSTLSGGVATFSISSLSIGTHSIVAMYLGDTNDLASNSIVLTQTVNPAPLIATGVNIVSTEGISFQGKLAHFTDADPNGIASDYTASINWGDGTTTNAVIVANSNGGFDVQGTHIYSSSGTKQTSISITDAGGSSATASGSATITPISTTTITLTSSQDPSISGQSVRFTATISPATATGTVQFNDTNTSPPTLLGTGTISSGNATFSTSSLSVGNHGIIARYLGDSNDAPNSSTVLTQTVNPLATATTTSLSSNMTLVTFGHSITFTVKVSPSSATGTVQLRVNGTSFGSPVTISSGQAIFSISTLAAGTDNITASYSGSSNFNPSTSNSVKIFVTSASSGTGQVGNGNLSSDSNLGELVSDFVHQRNALLKEQRSETLDIIHECHAQMKSASHVDRKQIHDECKLKLKESRDKFKELQKKLRQEFEQLKDQFQSEIKQLHTQQEMDEKNETQNINNEIKSLQGEIRQLHTQEKIDKKNMTQTFNQEISLLKGNGKNPGNGSDKHGENDNAKGKHGHKEKGNGDN